MIWHSQDEMEINGIAVDDSNANSYISMTFMTY